MTAERGQEAGSPQARAPRAVHFTYADYLELRAWEFEKFRDKPPISDQEVAAVDWDQLFGLLTA